MAVISRALVKGSRARRKAKQKSEEDKIKEAVKARIAEYPEVWINLDKHQKIVENADLDKSENKFLFIEKLEQGKILGKTTEGSAPEELNREILEQFEWIDLEFLKITAYPVTRNYIQKGIIVRFLLWTGDIPEALNVKAYAEINKETFFPESVITEFSLNQNTILATDLFISGDMKGEEQNYFLTLFSFSQSAEMNEMFLKIRIKALIEKKEIETDNYQELKESNFLNLIEQKHIHPLSIKSIVKKLKSIQLLFCLE